MKRENISKIKILIFGISIIFAFIFYGGITLNIGIINESDDLEQHVPTKTAAVYMVSEPITINNWTKANIDYPWINGAGNWGDPYIIENVIFDGDDSESCLIIQNSDKYFIIRNCTFANSSYSYIEGFDVFHAGIKLINVTNGLIKNNTIEQNTIGIYSDILCRNITISENYFNNSAQAIYLIGGDFNITSNTMNSTGIKIPTSIKTPTSTIITIETATTHIIESNTLNGKLIYYIANSSSKNSVQMFGSDTTTPGQVLAINVSYSTFSGLHIECKSSEFQMIFSYNNTITNNNFTSIDTTTNTKGISIELCDNITISSNNINNCYHGIRILDTYHTYIKNNNNISNNYYGIQGINNGEAPQFYVIKNNHIMNNNIIDIDLPESYSDIIGNNITSKGIAGIKIDDSIQCQIIGNNLNVENNLGEKSSGIAMITCIDSNISSNNINNYYYGIQLKSYSTGNIVSLNNITNSSFCGINIDSSSDNNITENKLESNADYSIYCEDSDNVIISWNNATDNNNTGIYVENCDDTEILYNHVVNCTSYGIYLDQSANCKINYNILSDNGICIGVHQLTCPNLEAINNSCEWTPLDKEKDEGASPGIPGYELLFIIGIAGVISIILLKTRKYQIKLN